MADDEEEHYFGDCACGAPGTDIYPDEESNTWQPDCDDCRKRKRDGVSLMTFGEAIEALKPGKRVARKGWNGKGMCLQYNVGTRGVLLGAGKFKTKGIDPHIDMVTAQKTLQVGWNASQADMVAEDWEVVF